MQINPDHYQSRPPLPDIVPTTQVDSSVHLEALLFILDDWYLNLIDMIFVCSTGPTSGNGEDRSQTISAPLDGADDEPQVESSET